MAHMTLRATLIGLTFVLIWSSAFTSGKFIVADAPPITALSIRFCISGLLAIGLAMLIGERLRLTRAHILAIVIFGTCQNGLYLGLNFVALRSVDASIAVVIASLLPITVALASWAFLRERLSALGVTGLAIGLMGAGIVFADRLEKGADAFGIILCILGVLALTLATLMVRTLATSGAVMWMVGLQMLVGAFVLAPFALAFETWEVRFTAPMLIAFTYTTLAPGIVATWMWFRLLAEIGATRAAAFHFLNPFFGVVVAWVFLGEQISRADVIGVAFIMVAILAVQVSKVRQSGADGL